MKNFYKVDNQRRYYIAKRISKKDNRENIYKLMCSMFLMWLGFFISLLLLLHLLDG